MENPEEEISGVIHLLTQSPPTTQLETIETYFTPNASFTHPFCRTGKWENSRFLIQVIYRWYKIMSPRIDITVHSVAFDKPNLLLYVSISQVFRIWIVPFYRAPVKLVTVLELKHNKGDNLYYIDSQNDLYQVDQFVRFIAPGFGKILVWMWQFWATFFCLLGAATLWPISLVEEYMGSEKQIGAGRRKKRKTATEEIEEIELRELDRMSKRLS
ncbi:hypothetical protein BDV96DRAFT_599597 [Lophiotrema nucula]|uniref:SigF-like NTF2-like domain-containing protein n=1 Tax=Lophiotrema nucula TaxID=690887 RepID=A0A6A5Z706_9PLEO|nr:hypothetical protein BDV96DRAFT_599597 [Lophiotrema nucula]